MKESILLNAKEREYECKMNKLLKETSSSTNQRIIWCLQCKDFSEEKVEKLVLEITRYILDLDDDLLYLRNLSDRINHDFSCESINKWKEADNVSKALKKGVNHVQRLANSFIPNWRKHRQLHREILKRGWDMSKYSILLAHATPIDMFGLEAYPEIVTLFCQRMAAFKQLLNDIRTVCQTILNQEKEIKDNPRYCHSLWIEYVEECNSVVSLLLQTIGTIENEENEPYRLRAECKDDLEWAGKAYHQFHEKDLIHYIARRSYDESQRMGLTQEEAALFGNKKEAIKNALILIDHFDALCPKKRIRRVDLAMLCFWCGGTTNKKKFYDFIEKRYHGHYKLLKTSAFYEGFVDLLKNPKEYDSFRQRAEALLQRVHEERKGAIYTIPLPKTGKVELC